MNKKDKEKKIIILMFNSLSFLTKQEYIDYLFSTKWIINQLGYNKKDNI